MVGGMTVLAPRSPRFRTGATIPAMALLLGACSSDDGTATPPAAPSAATVTSAEMTEGGVSTAESVETPAETPADTPAATPAETPAEVTSAAEITAGEPADVPDEDAEGVCRQLPVATVAGLLAVELDIASYSEVATVPECTYSSTYSIYGYTVGILPGGAGQYDEQVQIRDMTSGGDAVVTTEPINGVDASLSVFTDMIGYPTASLMMVQGSDLIVVRGNGGTDASLVEITDQVKTLAGYVASTVVG